MNTVVINGKKYTSNGGSISVVNNKVYIDGKLASDENDTKQKTINIVVEGNVNGSVSTDSGNVNINGDAGYVKTASGNVNVTGKVTGLVSTTSGDVEVGGSVESNVNTVSGDVTIKGNVNGSTKTVSGDIKEEKKGFFKKALLDLI